MPKFRADELEKLQDALRVVHCLTPQGAIQLHVVSEMMNFTLNRLQS